MANQLMLFAKLIAVESKIVKMVQNTPCGQKCKIFSFELSGA
jgi:hypothetical protein